MAYDIAKQLALMFGLYRQARWFNRHFLNREELKQEKSDLAFYAKILHKNDLVFDVGANYGEKTRVFLKLGAKVVAFEPQPDCMKELKLRCGDSKMLITIESALSSKPGTGKLYVRTHRGASGLIKNWERKSDIDSVIEVHLVTLDEMISTFGRPVYIKIDVEGYEYEVLKGLSHQVPLISFEYHFRDDGTKKAIDCIDYLSNLGEISLNITPAENLVLEYPQWLNKEDFLKLFSNDIQRKTGFGYGEIWVKM